MQCKNHPDKAAADRCTGCAEPFCPDCLVEIQGQKYCGACKTMALRGAPATIDLGDEASIPCKEAGEALTYAIISLFCFGIILGPVAISKAMKAKKMIALNPRLSGSGKASAGLIIGIIATILWVLGMISKFAALGQSH
jgi:hypothetical protein